MKLPPYKINRCPEFQRHQLSVWLAEREIDRVLEDPDAKNPDRVSIRYDRRSSKVLPGEVYILNPSDHDQRPLYILVLEKLADQSFWLVAPFGRYATPAVPGEWATGIKDPPLRVLCLWNTFEISAAEFLPGAARRLPPKVFRDVMVVYRHVTMGETADRRLIKRLGPPIVHPADPRHEHLDEERSRIERYARDDNVIDFEPADLASSARWRLAAEGRPRYGQKDE